MKKLRLRCHRVGKLVRIVVSLVAIHLSLLRISHLYCVVLTFDLVEIGLDFRFLINQPLDLFLQTHLVIDLTRLKQLKQVLGMLLIFQMYLVVVGVFLSDPLHVLLELVRKYLLRLARIVIFSLKTIEGLSRRKFRLFLHFIKDCLVVFLVSKVDCFVYLFVQSFRFVEFAVQF